MRRGYSRIRSSRRSTRRLSPPRTLERRPNPVRRRRTPGRPEHRHRSLPPVCRLLAARPAGRSYPRMRPGSLTPRLRRSESGSQTCLTPPKPVSHRRHVGPPASGAHSAGTHSTRTQRRTPPRACGEPRPAGLPPPDAGVPQNPAQRRERGLCENAAATPRIRGCPNPRRTRL
jgi:hypothetical protein